MIDLTLSVSGSQIGNELAHDAEELAYALAAICEAGVDELDREIAEHLYGEQREQVRDLCIAISLSLADE